MGAWDTSIKGNDTTMDIYDHFMERYSSGANSEDVSKEVLDEFKEYFNDDDRNDALFGLALAQWETASLDPSVFAEVKKIVETGEDIVRWRQLEASEADVRRRKKALEKFLQQISVPREKPKRRQRKQFDFKHVELVRAVAPDKMKEFRITESYVNGEYEGTQGFMDWGKGGSGILAYRKQGARITAVWETSQKLVVTHDKDIDFLGPLSKQEKFFFCGDSGVIEYVSAD